MSPPDLDWTMDIHLIDRPERRNGHPVLQMENEFLSFELPFLCSDEHPIRETLQTFVA